MRALRIWDPLMTDSAMRAYGTCHWRDSTACTLEPNCFTVRRILMKGAGASTMLSKKIKTEKATPQETFMACLHIKSTLVNVPSVNDDDHKNHPVSKMLIRLEGYIPQKNDNLQSDQSGGFLIPNFDVSELCYTKLSWEAMGISKGQLPSTTIFYLYENERHPFMLINWIVGYSSMNSIPNLLAG